MRFKVLSLNLYEGGLLFGNIPKLLNREQAGLMLFQEAYNGSGAALSNNYKSVELISSMFPEYYRYFSAELNDMLPFGSVEEGNLLFSKWPMLSKRTKFFVYPYDPLYKKTSKKGDFSNDPKAMQIVSMDMNGRNITVINLHGIWGKDGKDNKDRTIMSNKIVSEIAGKKPVIVAGDFNATPTTQAIANIKNHLTNVFDGDIQSTFNMKHKKDPGYSTAVVDMMFVSSDIRIIKKYIPNDDVSDHVPLVALLEIN